MFLGKINDLKSYMLEKGISVSDNYLRTNVDWSLGPKGQEEGIEFGKCNFYTTRKDGAYPKYIVQTYSVGELASTVDKMIVPEGGEVSVLRGPGVSAHYIVDRTGEIYCMVPDFARAWAAGGGSLKTGSKLNSDLPDDMRNVMNDYAISILCINNGKQDFTPEQTRAALELTGYLSSEYGIVEKNIVALSDWTSRHIAPGPYFPWGEFAEHHLGMWPKELEQKTDEKVVLDWKSPSSEDLEQLRSQFEELGYIVPEGQELARAVRFNLHYRGQNIVETPDLKEVYDNMLWADSSDIPAMEILGSWGSASQDMLEQLLGQY